MRGATIIRKKKVRLISAGIAGTIIVVIVVILILAMRGIICLNDPGEDFPVRGVDVSSYQGKIDWQTLSSQNIDFAYIKATEGSTFQDSCFKNNWAEAKKTKLYVGAYHFVSFESSGKKQAANFIATVPDKKDMLVPALDVELYGRFNDHPLPEKDAEAILTPLIETVENEYGAKPVIYCTRASYDLYIKNNYSDYPIWIRSIFSKPAISGSKEWTFWQYSSKGRLRGFEGKEKFIDMNTFCGDINSLDEFYLK